MSRLGGAGFLPPPGKPPERARICTQCNGVPKKVVWRWYSSSESSWASLAGREGYIASCEKHGQDVYEEWTLVS